jgi:hypothetical protein
MIQMRRSHMHSVLVIFRMVVKLIEDFSSVCSDVPVLNYANYAIVLKTLM